MIDEADRSASSLFEHHPWVFLASRKMPSVKQNKDSAGMDQVLTLMLPPGHICENFDNQMHSCSRIGHSPNTGLRIATAAIASIGYYRCDIAPDDALLHGQLSVLLGVIHRPALQPALSAKTPPIRRPLRSRTSLLVKSNIAKASRRSPVSAPNEGKYVKVSMPRARSTTAAASRRRSSSRRRETFQCQSSSHQCSELKASRDKITIVSH
jgi:hypothetical protein